MADLSTTYMGIELGNPVVVAACALSNKVDTIKKLEELGAGGLVIKSLFEEQILHEMGELDDALEQGSESFAESTSYFPKLQHGEAREHLMWIERARQAVKMPLMASLNAVHPGKWVEYARQLAGTGVDGLELNMYAVETDPEMSSEEIENRTLDTFASVQQAVDLPLAVKLSPFYTNVGRMVNGLEERGARAVVLFNRFLQPDIDPESETLRVKMDLSTPTEMRLPLRWVALLYGKTMLDLAGNTGATQAAHVAKYILAGASVVQVASTLLRNGVSHMSDLVSGLGEWMDGKGYAKLEDFRGKVSQQGYEGDQFAFERAHYLDLLRGQKG